MDLGLIAFDGVNTAAEAFADARERSGTSGWQEQVGLVEHRDGGQLVLRGSFAGHYVDVDERAHASEEGASKGWRIGALIGLLLGPAGVASGSVLGTVIGSQEGEADETERAPTVLVDKLRSAVPASGSAVVLVADAAAVDEMLSAFELRGGEVTRRTLTADELAVLNTGLDETPTAATPATSPASSPERGKRGEETGGAVTGETGDVR
jgi:uncharacterized membrane protein